MINHVQIIILPFLVSIGSVTFSCCKNYIISVYCFVANHYFRWTGKKRLLKEFNCQIKLS